MHGIRKLVPTAGAALLEDAIDHLFGEKRVATGAGCDLGNHLGEEVGVLGFRDQRPDEPGRVRVGQRLEEDRLGVAPPAAPFGTPLKDFVASEADEHQRAAHPAREVLDQVQHSLVGPVDVFDDEHQRPAVRNRFGHRPHRREDHVAHLLGVLDVDLRTDLPWGFDTKRAGHQRGDALGVLVRRLLCQQRADSTLKLSEGSVRVVGVDDLELAADDLAEGPVGEGGAVGGAAADADDRLGLPAGQLVDQITQQARLADPGRAHHRDEVWTALADDPLVDRHQPSRLIVATDQRRFGPDRRCRLHRVSARGSLPRQVPVRTCP